MQEICVGFEMSLPQKNPKKKICTLCYGTGSIRQPNGVKVPCPKGCRGFLSSTSVRFVLNNNLVVVYETGKCDVLC